MSDRKIIGYEYRHGTYTVNARTQADDLVTIKEIIHYDNGDKEPNVRLIKNFKRKLYYTRPGFQNHKDKKEWEDINRLQCFETTQVKLNQAVVRAMGYGNPNTELKRIARTPFLYGTDVATTVLIKHQYMQRWPNLITESKVGIMDIEKDIIDGTDAITVMSLTCKDRARVAVTKQFLGTTPNAEEQIHSMFERYLGKYKESRHIKLEVYVAENEADAIVNILSFAHEIKPDIIGFWNIDYDMPNIIDALNKYGLDPADVFSDPSVPFDYRYFKYKRGANVKIDRNGDRTALDPQERWHTVQCPASFYFVDAMCLYYQVRRQKGKDTSYALDYQLMKNLKDVRKLKFKEADHIHTTVEWHQFMQRNYKIEYVIYNLFDCISVELLDEMNKDMAVTYPSQCGFSDLSSYTSQTRRLADDLHFFCLERGRVICAVSDQMEDENDRYIIGLNGWICTLPAHLVDRNGLRVCRDIESLDTMIRAFVADLDVKSSYPTTGVFMNISKETTKRELCRIRDVSEYQQRRCGLNMVAGKVNAIDIGINLFHLPTTGELVSAFLKERNLEPRPVKSTVRQKDLPIGKKAGE